jgi:hypothetical protein
VQTWFGEVPVQASVVQELLSLQPAAVVQPQVLASG